MKQTLRTLQQKPAHVRERIAYVTAGIGTLAIFAVWMVTFITTQPLSVNTQKAERTQTGNPFAELTQSIQTGFAGAAAAIDDFQELEETQTQFEGEARLEVVETYRVPEEEQGRTDSVTF